MVAFLGFGGGVMMYKSVAWVATGLLSGLAFVSGCSSSSGNSGGGGGSQKVVFGQPGCTGGADCGNCAACMDSCLCETNQAAMCQSACASNGGQGGSGNFGGFGAAAGSAGMAGAGAVAGQGGSGGSTTPPPGSIGAPCTDNSQCGTDVNAKCLPESSGWPHGYCTVAQCTKGSCPTGSECYETTAGNAYCFLNCQVKSECPANYACHSLGACVPECEPGDCDAGEVCNPGTGLCEPAPCTAGSCGGGLKCDTASGKCIPDSGTGPGPGPGPTCSNLPQRDCTGTAAYCGELSSFEPKLGPGYDDYPINGETPTNQYRSYARRDMQMLIKYAAAYVDCKAKSWNTGNGGAIGLGDMSEANGAIPGTSVGSPGHPAGTHLNGNDMDIGYFQAGTPNNYLRPICEHTSGGQDQYHCTQPPHLLDLWRTSLFLGALFTSKTVRVIGVDGQVGPLVEQTMPYLCSTGWLPQYSCDAMLGKFGSTKQYGLVFETTNTGAGWYQFHHHHMHISLNGNTGVNPNAFAPGGDLFGNWVPGSGLVPGMESVGPLLDFANVPGHGWVGRTPLRRLNVDVPQH